VKGGFLLEIKTLKDLKNELKIEISGEGHTFCNLLQQTLLEDGDVEIAGYDQPHPLFLTPIIYIRMKGDKSPSKALQKALTKIRERAVEFSEEFAKSRKSAT
jgi:DNA-directed RNA polymerase subunit L